MDRFSPEFIRKRQFGLERFLQRVIIHPRLSKHTSLKSFLTRPILGIDEAQSSPKIESPSGMAAVVEQISDVVVNVFSKSRTVDEKFIHMKKTIGIVEGHLEKITTLHGNLSISFKGVSDALMTSGQAFNQISLCVGQMERIVSAGSGLDFVEGRPLRSVLGDYGQLLEERSAVTARMGEEMDIKAHLLLGELGQYCRSAKQALKLRDQKQFEWQDIADHLESSKEEHSQLSGEPTAGNAGVADKLRANKSAMMSFLSERLEALRGVDPVTARAERIKKLEEKMKELEEVAVTSQDQSKEIDATILSEFTGFTSMLSREIKNELVPNLRDTWIPYHQQELELFSSFAKDTLNVGTEQSM
jgi:sorting nexin-4